MKKIHHKHEKTQKPARKHQGGDKNKQVCRVNDPLLHHLSTSESEWSNKLWETVCDKIFRLDHYKSYMN